jgi:hypothetical protein
MFKKNLNAPLCLGSPKNAIPLNRYYVLTALSVEVEGGGWHCPLLHLTCAFYFIS